MNSFFLAILPIVLATLLIACLAFWLSSSEKELAIRLPGMDGTPPQDELKSTTQRVDIGEFFKRFTNSSPLSSHLSWCQAANWPCFRGERRNNLAPQSARIRSDWKTRPPKEIWHMKLLGEGHAAPAIRDGKVYILDYNEKIKADALRCISLEKGTEIWRRWYKVKSKRNHGISRTIPAVSDKYVVTIGPKCQVMCVDAVNGDLKWGLDLVEKLGTETPFWYTGQCPLIDDEVAVLAPCGKKILMMGIECETGKVLWKTPNDFHWKMSHSSVISAKINGVKTYVYAALGGIVGVSGRNGERGKILWSTTEWNYSVVAPSPVYLGDGRFLITSGYGAGGMVFQVTPDNKIKVEKKYPPGKGICAEQQTPVTVGNRMYSILPKDAGGLRERFACYSINDPTKPLWSSGTKRFGLGPYIFVDGKFLLLDDDGTLYLILPNDSGMRVLGEFQAIPKGNDAWGPIAVSGSKILVRDLTRLYCYDLAP